MGIIDIVKELLNRINKIFDQEKVKKYANIVMEAAAKGGYIDIVKYALSNGDDMYKDSFYPALINDNSEIVRFMVQVGINDSPSAPYGTFKHKYLNKLLKQSANDGKEDEVNIVLSVGANDIDKAIILAKNQSKYMFGDDKDKYLHIIDMLNKAKKE